MKKDTKAPGVDDTPDGQRTEDRGQRAELPKAVQTLEELQQICSAPLNCSFVLNDKLVTVEVHRLTPVQTDTIEAVKREIVPPMIKGRPPEPDRPDWDNPKYKSEFARQQKIARALTIYFGCPLFAAEKPGLTNREHIHDFVQTKLTDLILEVIYLTISGEALRVREVNEKVNFT